jgi:hypothetical protein
MLEQETEGFETIKLNEQERTLRSLFFQSFRFSQGGAGLQKEIQKWLVVKGYFDNVDIPKTIPHYIKAIAIPKKHKPVPGDRRLSELGKMWDQLLLIRYEKQSLSEEKLLPTVLLFMIDRDTGFQQLERPCEQHFGQVTPDSSNDPHASFVRKYLVNAHPTGNNAFDKLHQSLALLVTRYRNASPTDPDFLYSKALSSLADQWEHNHLGHTFFLPENTTSAGVVEHGALYAPGVRLTNRR